MGLQDNPLFSCQKPKNTLYVEFGIDQGRIGYLLNDIKSKDESFDFK